MRSGVNFDHDAIGENPVMSDHRPWFLVMRPSDANQPGSNWVRLGAASRGKVVVRPITSEGWLSLAAFVAALVAAMLAIWAWAVRSGIFSVAFAILATVLVLAIVIGGFIRLVMARMTGLPPS
jgi:hypothetical protein